MIDELIYFFGVEEVNDTTAEYAFVVCRNDSTAKYAFVLQILFVESHNFLRNNFPASRVFNSLWDPLYVITDSFAVKLATTVV